MELYFIAKADEQYIMLKKCEKTKQLKEGKSNAIHRTISRNSNYHILHTAGSESH
jgi:phage FluMu protein Com